MLITRIRQQDIIVTRYQQVGLLVIHEFGKLPARSYKKFLDVCRELRGDVPLPKILDYDNLQLRDDRGENEQLHAEDEKALECKWDQE